MDTLTIKEEDFKKGGEAFCNNEDSHTITITYTYDLDKPDYNYQIEEIISKQDWELFTNETHQQTIIACLSALASAVYRHSHEHENGYLEKRYMFQDKIRALTGTVDEIMDQAMTMFDAIVNP